MYFLIQNQFTVISRLSLVYVTSRNIFIFFPSFSFAMFCKNTKKKEKQQPPYKNRIIIIGVTVNADLSSFLQS